MFIHQSEKKAEKAIELSKPLSPLVRHKIKRDFASSSAAIPRFIRRVHKTERKRRRKPRKESCVIFFYFFAAKSLT